MHLVVHLTRLGIEAVLGQAAQNLGLAKLAGRISLHEDRAVRQDWQIVSQSLPPNKATSLGLEFKRPGLDRFDFWLVR